MGSEHTSRRQEIVKHGEKESRIDQFLGFYLDRVFADWGDRPDQHHLTLIARSPASPAARAIVSNAPDLLSAGVSIRVVFAQLDPAELMSDWSDLVLVAAESDTARNVELARLSNAALIDAHEQMVLGTDMSWCGDAMRRDPLQRDTVEVFDPCCPETATQSQRCFVKLWSRSEVIRVANRTPKPDVATGNRLDQGAGVPPANTDGLPGSMLASTRH